jgi:hypothetical protein
MLRFIIKSVAIYINPMFTHYLIKVAWGGDARVCACVAINFNDCGVAKYYVAGLPIIEEVLLRKLQPQQKYQNFKIKKSIYPIWRLVL